MTGVYVHFSDKDADRAILGAQGVKVEKKLESIRKARICLYCKSPNPAIGKYCQQCGRPLDHDEAKLLDERVDKVTSALKKSNLITDEEKEIIENISTDNKDEIVAIFLRSLKNMGKFEDLRNNF
ncbi:MAG: DNA integration/recombination/inversion protein [Thermoplasmatales archaeon I-plasma]|jgi:hypothetical protein|nr:MAG: DNA integration/recombination/inversion protein [Thermoplasmatales archaeon I-plasma]